MASECVPVVCSTTCDNPLPQMEFDVCAPKVNIAEIEEILFTNIGNPLTDETDPAEWATRKALLATDPERIVSIICTAEKPAAESNTIKISRDISVTPSKTHTITGDVHETSQANYDALREYECARKVLMWYRTAGGLLYGGAAGIEASIVMNEVISKTRKELIIFQFSLTWDAKHHPCRTLSPF